MPPPVERESELLAAINRYLENAAYVRVARPQQQVLDTLTAPIQDEAVPRRGRQGRRATPRRRWEGFLMTETRTSCD